MWSSGRNMYGAVCERVAKQLHQAGAIAAAPDTETPPDSKKLAPHQPTPSSQKAHSRDKITDKELTKQAKPGGQLEHRTHAASSPAQPYASKPAATATDHDSRATHNEPSAPRPGILTIRNASNATDRRVPATVRRVRFVDSNNSSSDSGREESNIARQHPQEPRDTEESLQSKDPSTDIRRRSFMTPSRHNLWSLYDDPSSSSFSSAGPQVRIDIRTEDMAGDARRDRGEVDVDAGIDFEFTSVSKTDDQGVLVFDVPHSVSELLKAKLRHLCHVNQFVYHSSRFVCDAVETAYPWLPIQSDLFADICKLAFSFHRQAEREFLRSMRSDLERLVDEDTDALAGWVACIFSPRDICVPETQQGQALQLLQGRLAQHLNAHTWAAIWSYVADIVDWEASGLGDRDGLAFFYVREVYFAVAPLILKLIFIERGSDIAPAVKQRTTDDIWQQCYDLVEALGYDARFKSVDVGLFTFRRPTVGVKRKQMAGFASILREAQVWRPQAGVPPPPPGYKPSITGEIGIYSPILDGKDVLAEQGRRTIQRRRAVSQLKGSGMIRPQPEARSRARLQHPERRASSSGAGRGGQAAQADRTGLSDRVSAAGDVD